MSALASAPEEGRIACVDHRDRMVAASLTYAIASRARMPRRACHELALAASELASNAVRHGGGGMLEIRVLTGPRVGIELVCSDRGPGIADPQRALEDGWSRGRERGPDDRWGEGLGTGLGAVQRATHELEIEHDPRGGTVVRARRWIAVVLERAR